MAWRAVAPLYAKRVAVGFTGLSARVCVRAGRGKTLRMPRVLLSSIPFGNTNHNTQTRNAYTQTSNPHQEQDPSTPPSTPPSRPLPPPSSSHTILMEARATLTRLAVQNTKLHQRCVKRHTLAQQQQHRSSDSARSRTRPLRRTRSSPAILPQGAGSTPHCTAASSAACSTAASPSPSSPPSPSSVAPSTQV